MNSGVQNLNLALTLVVRGGSVLCCCVEDTGTSSVLPNMLVAGVMLKGSEDAVICCVVDTFSSLQNWPLDVVTLKDISTESPALRTQDRSFA